MTRSTVTPMRASMASGRPSERGGGRRTGGRGSHRSSCRFLRALLATAASAGVVQRFEAARWRARDDRRHVCARAVERARAPSTRRHRCGATVAAACLLGTRRRSSTTTERPSGSERGAARGLYLRGHRSGVRGASAARGGAARRVVLLGPALATGGPRPSLRRGRDDDDRWGQAITITIAPVGRPHRRRTVSVVGTLAANGRPSWRARRRAGPSP
jgi:hypothetical protein